MRHISEKSLIDLSSRIQYLRDFIEFTEKDAAALHASRDIVASLVPAIVDTVYEKLLSFDITAQSFVPRQTGYLGEAPATLSGLSSVHPQISFRKDFLKGYLLKLVTMDYSKPSSWEYLDKVGLMHTGQSAFSHRVIKPTLRVEYVHCAILLAYVEDILLNTVMAREDLALDTKNTVVRAANKILWIQNDLFARHYLANNTSAEYITIKRTTMLAIIVCMFGMGLFLTRAF